jgi:ketosteroid isomerase-like protein
MAMKRLIVIAALVLAACAMSTPATPGEPNADVLLQLDREFAKQSSARGAVAWQEIMAPNAVKPANGGRWLTGPEEIGNNMREAFASGFTLAWEPTRAEISRGGKLGYTWGRYHSLFSGKAREGTYMTVWQKQPDGSWKVLFDTGDPD